MATSSKKGRILSSRHQNHQQLTHKRKVYPATEGLRSEQTATQYHWHFRTFIKYLEDKFSKNIVEEMLLDWEPKEFENLIIEYLKYMHEVRHLKHSTINAAECCDNAFLQSK